MATRFHISKLAIDLRWGVLDHSVAAATTSVVRLSHSMSRSSTLVRPLKESSVICGALLWQNREAPSQERWACSVAFCPCLVGFHCLPNPSSLLRLVRSRHHESLHYSSSDSLIVFARSPSLVVRYQKHLDRCPFSPYPRTHDSNETPIPLHHIHYLRIPCRYPQVCNQQRGSSILSHSGRLLFSLHSCIENDRHELSFTRLVTPLTLDPLT